MSEIASRHEDDEKQNLKKDLEWRNETRRRKGSGWLEYEEVLSAKTRLKC